MSDLYGLTFEAMTNNMVNYGRTDNGIAVIELALDSADSPARGRHRGEHLHPRHVPRLDEAIIRARFDGRHHRDCHHRAGEKFFSAGASIRMLNSVSPGFKYNCLHANETSPAWSKPRKS